MATFLLYSYKIQKTGKIKLLCAKVVKIMKKKNRMINMIMNG